MPPRSGWPRWPTPWRAGITSRWPPSSRATRARPTTPICRSPASTALAVRDQAAGQARTPSRLGRAPGGGRVADGHLPGGARARRGLRRRAGVLAEHVPRAGGPRAGEAQGRASSGTRDITWDYAAEARTGNGRCRHVHLGARRLMWSIVPRADLVLAATPGSPPPLRVPAGRQGQDRSAPSCRRSCWPCRPANAASTIGRV